MYKRQLVDRYSGYAWTQELRRTDTTTVVGQLSDWFIEVGWPTAIRTDGGLQFRTEFSQFCDKHGIKHELSSPYNPESNGLAEAAVKNIKAIITRCHKERENIKLAIAAWRNMARTDGVSPSQLFYGRRQRQLLPLTGEQAKTQASSTAAETKQREIRNVQEINTPAITQNSEGKRRCGCCLLYTSPSPRD